MSVSIRRARWGALAAATSLLAYTASLTPDRKAALDRISAQSLQGHIWFLASDLLEGRDTPSRGLDIAAEYIAAQFRRIGLKPVGDDGYFQTARYVSSEQSVDGAELCIRMGEKDLRIGKDDLRILSTGKAEFSEVVPLKVNLDHVKPEEVKGKVIVIAIDKGNAMDALIGLQPAAALITYPRGSKAPALAHNLKESGQPWPFPAIRVQNREFHKLIDAAKPGPMEAILSLRLPAPVDTPVNLRNVVGVLPGSDPALAESYVVISAHYDHIGKKLKGEGDLIYNGANDDASGVASVIEIASALSAARPGSRRSILFITYFGEEKGLLGSRYYGRHPLVPLKNTVADLNLEHLGRTDGENGEKPGTATMTGFGYSELTTAFEMAGAVTGIKIYRPRNDGDAYFARSDNQALADQGVPAHTIVTTFEFPDYHEVGDEWNKIDYPNLEKVDRTIALTVMMIADDPQPPHWNEANAKTAKYAKAWRELK